MTTLYAGNPDNVSDSLVRTVIDATNASPIVVQTSVPHLFSDGDYVEVASVTGNTAANGSWRITAVDADHFSLNGSTGNGAFVAGGTATDKSLTPAITEPQDGELRSVASVETMTRVLADRTQFLARRGPVRHHTMTAAGTFVVPPGCTEIDVDLVGGGGGGGGGRGNGTSGDLSAPGGGGAKRYRFRCTVVPGETLTFAPGAGGTGGTAGDAAGNPGTAGAHGGDSTLTGSTSGLLATARGAQGAMFATVGGWCAGGLPSRWSTGATSHTYPNTSVTPLTIAGKFYPTFPISGQGGHSGASELADVMMKWGGGTAYSAGGSTGTVDSTYSGSGGASEWPGGIGGSGSAFNTFVHHVDGGNGIFGSGGGGGTGGYTGNAAGKGGNGGDGACQIGYSGPKAVTT